MRPETLARLAHVLGVPVETLEETFPKGAALGDWREALRALTNAERFNMALAAAPGDAWPGGAALGNLASLKSFTVAYNVSPSQVLAELEATMPGLRETLDRLHRQAQEKAEEYRREAQAMAEQAAAELDAG
jgi:hypothetical protein